MVDEAGRKHLAALARLFFATILAWDYGISVQASMSCQQQFTKDAPFFISDASGQGRRNWENFRYIKDHRGKAGYLPRRSLVRVNADFPPQAGKSTNFLPVTVISLPNPITENVGRKSRFPIRDWVASGPNRAQVGDVGYLAAKSLTDIDGYTFVVEEDSTLLEIPGMENLLGRALRLAQDSSGNFMTNHCCTVSAEAGRQDCIDNYVFEILSPDLTAVDDAFYFDPQDCAAVMSLRPIARSQFPAFKEILDMVKKEGRVPLRNIQFIDSMGMVKLPLTSLRGSSEDQPNNIGPFGSYHYRAEGGPDIADDSFLQLASACAFMKVLEQQSKRCLAPGCQVQWGNAFHPLSWGVHHDHEGGECIDIRPLKKKDSIEGRDDATGTVAHFDPGKTKEFLNLLKAAGASPIYFNLVNMNGVTAMDGHDDHIHACFQFDNPAVKKACEEPIE